MSALGHMGKAEIHAGTELLKRIAAEVDSGREERRARNFVGADVLASAFEWEELPMQYNESRGARFGRGGDSAYAS